MYTPPLFPPFPPLCCWPFCRKRVLVVEAFTTFSRRLDNTPLIKEDEELIDDISATTFLLKLLLIGEEEEDVAPVEPLEALVALLLLLIIVAEKRFSLSLSSSQTVQKQQMRKSLSSSRVAVKWGKIGQNFWGFSNKKKRLFKILISLEMIWSVIIVYERRARFVI